MFGETRCRRERSRAAAAPARRDPLLEPVLHPERRLISLSFRSKVIRRTGRPRSSLITGSRSRKLSSYESVSIWAATPADRVGVLRPARPCRPSPSAGRPAAMVLAVPMGFFSIVALAMPPAMNPRPEWSKLSASQSSTAVYWPIVPLYRFSRRPLNRPLTDGRAEAVAHVVLADLAVVVREPVRVRRRRREQQQPDVLVRVAGQHHDLRRLEVRSCRPSGT